MTTPTLTSALMADWVNCKPAFVKLMDDNNLLCEDAVRLLNLFMVLSAVTVRQANIRHYVISLALGH